MHPQEIVDTIVEQFEEARHLAEQLPHFALEVDYTRDITDDEPTIQEAWAALERFKARRQE